MDLTDLKKGQIIPIYAKVVTVFPVTHEVVVELFSKTTQYEAYVQEKHLVEDWAVKEDKNYLNEYIEELKNILKNNRALSEEQIQSRLKSLELMKV